MRTIAITGHRGLPSDTSDAVKKDIDAALAKHKTGTIRGVSCLADGADQLFALAVLAHGGTLTAVIPATKYRDGLPQSCWPTYDELLSKATNVIRLDHTESTGESHMAASQRMLDDADELFAVWDGKLARGYGGTADIVAEAQRRNLEVTRIWPEGASRD
jgi:hypothetical protein